MNNRHVLAAFPVRKFPLASGPLPTQAGRERKKHKAALASLGVWLLLILVPRGADAQAPAARRGSIAEHVISSRALEGNVVGDSSERRVLVYLPPSYAEQPTRRYPVIYLLHGYQGSCKQWVGGGWNIQKVVDRLIADKKVREMMIVMPDANNKYGGGFYTNSVTIGNWEDFVAADLVSFIDKKYRTKAQPSSRGIAGHSMGGYGALRLAMKHPDVFAAVYGLSAACMGWGGDLTTENPIWDKTLSFKKLPALNPRDADTYLAEAFLALAAAWSPSPDAPPLFVDFPVVGLGPDRKRREDVCARWSANMPVAMADQYRSQLARLRGIAFDVGRRDEFPHIPLTNRAFHQALQRNGIAHSFEEYDGTHNDHIPERIVAHLLPFFSRVLTFDVPSTPPESSP
jgi:S-formylglutathione hydrolase